ncbi:MAG: SDR family NAD(P)-dependent oxidoreductase [Nevskia sp.]|nr:SDR family NAD(P)-dependent oxidoreductase [Nevskia sp.]
MFRNQHVVITGGSSGLGLALAFALAREGARISLIARDPRKLEAAANAIRTEVRDARVGVKPVDVADEAAAQAAIGELAWSEQGVDVLINSAGILREGYFEDLAMTDFRQVMDINLFGLLHVTRAALPHLKRSQGRLVNIASMAGLSGVFGYTPYCAAKHALVGLTDSLRYELAPQGVKVHLVCPAEFDSPMVDALDRSRTPENRAHTLTIPKTGVEVIVKGTLAGIRAGRFLIVPGTRTRMASFFMRHFPGITRMVGDRAIRQVYAGPEHHSSSPLIECRETGLPLGNSKPDD